MPDGVPDSERPTAPRIRDYGSRALLLETSDPLGLLHAIRGLIGTERPNDGAERDTLGGLVDVVPAAETLLLTFTDAAACGRARSLLAGVVPVRHASAGGDLVSIPVTYDGADLDEVARLTGLSRESVIERHQSSPFEVGFIGFAPGFAYLTGLDPALHVPRLDTPRTSVPAGSVAIAGPYGAVYPTSSPGGWRLLGRTTAAVFDVHRDPPAVLIPGTRVRFEATR